MYTMEKSGINLGNNQTIANIFPKNLSKKKLYLTSIMLSIAYVIMLNYFLIPVLKTLK